MLMGGVGDLRAEDLQKQLAEKEAAFVDLILRAYRAEPVQNFPAFHGKKAGRMVVVGPVNLPVTRRFVEEIILECRKKHLTRVDILGFEFEMGLFPNIQNEAKEKGIDLALKYIPAEVFDKRAVERNQVVFHDVSFIEVKPHVKGNQVAVELTDFSVFYSQDADEQLEAAIKNKGSKIVVRQGKIMKISKDKDGVTTREVLTKHWTDWIDYWSVDFDFENKREIIRVPKVLDPDAQTKLPGVDSAKAPHGMGRSVDRRLRVRKRMAIVPHEEESHAGAKKPAARIARGTAQAGGQSRRYLRQRHDDNRRGDRRKGQKITPQGFNSKAQGRPELARAHPG